MGTPVTLLMYGTVREERGIDLDDVNLAVVHHVLDIDQAHDLQLAGKAAGVIHHGALITSCAEVLRRVDRDGVAGMHAGALDMLHDARDQVILAVADGVYLALRCPAGTYPSAPGCSCPHALVMMRHVFDDIAVVVGDDHILAAQHVGRAQQHRDSPAPAPPARASSQVNTVRPCGRGNAAASPAARRSAPGPPPRRWHRPGCRRMLHARPRPGALVSLMAVWPPNCTTHAVTAFRWR